MNGSEIYYKSSLTKKETQTKFNATTIKKRFELTGDDNRKVIIWDMLTVLELIFIIAHLVIVLIHNI